MGKMKAAVRAAVVLLSVGMIFTVAVPKAEAQLFYDAEVKAAYEDNVIGLLSDKRGGPAGGAGGSGMVTAATGTRSGRDNGSQSSGDFSIDLFADIGVSKDVSDKTSLFLMGSIENITYGYYTQFDSTIGGLNAGASTNLTDTVTSRFAVFVRIKGYGDSQRDGSSFGGTLSFKEQLDKTFSLKESYEYENYTADSPSFSYVGNSLGITAGVKVSPDIKVYLGYTYLQQAFQEPAGSTMQTQTISLEVEKKLSRRLFVEAGFDHIISRTSEPSTTAEDNMIFAGLRYSH